RNRNSGLTISTEQVAKVTGAPRRNVYLYWPLVRRELERKGNGGRKSLTVAIAVIAVDAPGFKPYLQPKNSVDMTRPTKGNSSIENFEPGDNIKYRRRGLVPLVGRAEYSFFGTLTHFDLENDPDLALEPEVAAKIFATMFKIRFIHELAAKSRWETARIRLTGLSDCMDEYLAIIEKLSMCTWIKTFSKRRRRNAG
ncbi:MAG: hypothetical protein ACRD3W_18845, partial [Terriglobales bacterium]